MPFDCKECKLNEMSGQYYVQNCPQTKTMNKIMDVITIDDDDSEEYVNNNNADETDEIEIIEIIPKSETITALTSSQMDEVKTSHEINSSSTPNLSIDETNKPLNDSCNSCLQTITDLKEDLNALNSELKSEEVVIESSDYQQISPKRMKSPKRITPITLQTPSTVSTSNAVLLNLSSDSSSDPTPNKLRRMSDLENMLSSGSEVRSSATEGNAEPQPSTSRPKVDFETLYQNYVKSLRDCMTALNVTQNLIQEMTQKLEVIYLKVKDNNSQFLNSSQFSKLMEVFTKEVLEMKSEERVVRHHSDLIIELNRFSFKPEKRLESKVKDKNKKIKDLTNTIKRLQKQICIAEHEEIDWDSLDRPSSFTDLPKLYSKVQQVWAKREELLKRSTYTGRVMFKKYKCNCTQYPEINSCAEQLLNSHLKKMKNKKTKGYVDESFTFIDVRKAILDVIKDKQLAIVNCEPIIEDVYKELLREKRIRRQKDSEEVFETLEELEDLKPETFAENDPHLELELAKNKMSFEHKINALFEKYAYEDKRKNGESMLKDGLTEWDSGLVNNNEEFESLDVNDGELEEEVEESDVESEEELEFAVAPIPDFNTEAAKVEEPAPNVSQAEVITNGNDDKSSDEIMILS